jgi:hypothetical protein
MSAEELRDLLSELSPAEQDLYYRLFVAQYASTSAVAVAPDVNKSPTSIGVSKHRLMVHLREAAQAREWSQGRGQQHNASPATTRIRW